MALAHARPGAPTTLSSATRCPASTSSRESATTSTCRHHSSACSALLCFAGCRTHDLPARHASGPCAAVPSRCAAWMCACVALPPHPVILAVIADAGVQVVAVDARGAPDATVGHHHNLCKGPGGKGGGRRREIDGRRSHLYFRLHITPAANRCGGCRRRRGCMQVCDHAWGCERRSHLRAAGRVGHHGWPQLHTLHKPRSRQVKGQQRAERGHRLPGKHPAADTA